MKFINFIFLNKKYQVDFQLFNKYSNYLSNNTPLFYEEDIYLLVDISNYPKMTEESIIAFCEYFHSGYANITDSNVFYLSYLSEQYQVAKLKEQTDQYIKEFSISIINYYLSNKIQDLQKENSSKIENLLSIHLLDFLLDDRLLNFPIPSLYRIFMRYFSSIQTNNDDKEKNNQIIDFIIKINRDKSEAATLFSTINYEHISTEYLNEKLYKNIKFIDASIVHQNLIQSIIFLSKQHQENEKIINKKIDELEKKYEYEINEIKEKFKNTIEYLFSEKLKSNMKAFRGGEFQNFPIEDIKVPSTVKTIESNSLSGNPFFKKIDIPATVEKIQEKSFSGCQNLSEITIDPYQVNIHPNSFLDYNLNQLSIATSKIVNTIIKSNFFNNFKKIIIPSTITSIDSYAFAECASLEQISIPSSVTLIRECAFYKCSSLKQLSIPSFVTSIGKMAFFGCSSLEQISISSSLTKIEDSTFYGCSSLEVISLPSSVTEIKDCAFYDCSSLKQISIPSSTTSFGNSIFYGVKSLEITGDIKLIPYMLFYGCSSIEQITISPSVTSIGEYAFSKCPFLKQIKLPSSVNSIESYAFEGCSSLEQISIPSSIKEIKSFVFSDCSSLKQILIPSSVTLIKRFAFNRCSSLKEILIPSSLTTIEESAFEGCTSLKEISLPSSMNSIKHCTFTKCSSLTDISIPSSINAIGESVFERCAHHLYVYQFHLR